MHFEKTLKGHQYGYQMKSLCLGSKNMLFIFYFHVCLYLVNINNDLFTFGETANWSSIWVVNEWSRPREYEYNVYFSIFVFVYIL